MQPQRLCYVRSSPYQPVQRVAPQLYQVFEVQSIEKVCVNYIWIDDRGVLSLHCLCMIWMQRQFYLNLILN